MKNTSQITKAMEVVSATKMRKSQQSALAARPYAMASLEILQNLLLRTPSRLLPPLLTPREVRRALIVVITSDKGLAGAFNANVLNKAEQRIAMMQKHDMPYLLVTVGKKAKDHFERRGGEIMKSFFGYGDYTRLEDTLAVANLMIGGFLDGSWGEAEAVYTNFRTTLVQETRIVRVLPASRESIEDAIRGILPERGKYATNYRGETSKAAIEVSPLYKYEYMFEPSPQEILAALVPNLIRVHIHQIIIESNASEHSARMVAMKNASDNAKELMKGLSLEYNKARQTSITRELIEVTAGAEAMHT